MLLCCHRRTAAGRATLSGGYHLLNFNEIGGGLVVVGEHFGYSAVVPFRYVKMCKVEFWIELMQLRSSSIGEGDVK